MKHMIARLALVAALPAFAVAAAADSLHSKGMDAMTPAMKDRLNTTNRVIARFPTYSAQLFSLVDMCGVWGQSTPITVCFVDDDTTYRSAFVSVAKTWLSYHPAYFDFGSPPLYRKCAGQRQELVRVAFRESEGASLAGNWGCVGKNSIRPDTECGKSAVSLNINPQTFAKDTSSPLFRHAVLHEMGHALGLEHEHQHPDARCWDQIDHNVAYAEYDPMPEDLVRKAFEVLVDKNVKVTRYDNGSVMHYFLEGRLFLPSPTPPSCQSNLNSSLSTADQFVIRTYYPENGPAPSSCLDDGNFLVSDLDLTMAQKRALGEELMPLLTVGAAPGAKFTLALKPGTEAAPSLQPKAFGPTPESVAPTYETDAPVLATQDCTPEALKDKGSCSLSADGATLEFVLRP